MLEPKKPKRDGYNLDAMLSKFLAKKYGSSKTRQSTSICPNIVGLSNYINQSLDTSEMESIKLHLARCKRCRRAVDSTLEAVRRFESGNLEDVPDNVSFDVNAYLKKLHSKDSGKPPKK